MSPVATPSLRTLFTSLANAVIAAMLCSRLLSRNRSDFVSHSSTATARARGPFVRRADVLFASADSYANCCISEVMGSSGVRRFGGSEVRGFGGSGAGWLALDCDDEAAALTYSRRHCILEPMQYVFGDEAAR
jgi:hypothetical protein